MVEKFMKLLDAFFLSFFCFKSPFGTFIPTPSLFFYGPDEACCHPHYVSLSESFFLITVVNKVRPSHIVLQLQEKQINNLHGVRVFGVSVSKPQSALLREYMIEAIQ